MVREQNQIKWICSINVIQRLGADIYSSDKGGAYTNALVFASSRDQAVEVLKASLDELGLDLEEIEDLEPFEDRIREREIDKKLMKLANQLDSQNVIRIGTFHTYPKEE